MELPRDKIIGKPLYLQVREVLLQRISNKEWKPGISLPNEMELSRELGVSIGTARKAFTLLREQGVITRHQGRGTFLRETSDVVHRYERISDNDGAPIRTQIADCQVRDGCATEEEQRKLKLSENVKVVRLDRLYTHHTGNPILYESAVFPDEMFPNFSADSTLHRLTTVELAQRFQIALGDMVELINFRAPEGKVMARLSPSKATTTPLCLDRVLMRVDGSVVEWRVRWCILPDGVSYRSGTS